MLIHFLAAVRLPVDPFLKNNPPNRRIRVSRRYLGPEAVQDWRFQKKNANILAEINDTECSELCSILLIH